MFVLVVVLEDRRGVLGGRVVVAWGGWWCLALSAAVVPSLLSNFRCCSPCSLQKERGSSGSASK